MYFYTVSSNGMGCIMYRITYVMSCFYHIKKITKYTKENVTLKYEKQNPIHTKKKRPSNRNKKSNDHRTSTYIHLWAQHCTSNQKRNNELNKF